MLQKQKLFFMILAGLVIFNVPLQAQDQLPPVANLEQDNMPPTPESAVLPDVPMLKKTNPEDIIFAHYKLSKTVPDIDNFAKLSPRVQKAQDIDKSAMTISEYNRMNNKYNLMNPKEPIIVHAILALDEYSSLQDIIVFDELNDKTYFKFPVYGENIAIVAKDISKFHTIAMSKARAEQMFEDLSGGTALLAEFVLTPEYADKKEPFTYEETDYWLMLATIGEIRLWSDTGENPKLAWYYRNPDYRPADKQALGDLFVQEPADAQ